MEEKLFICVVKGAKEEVEIALEFFATLELSVNANTNIEEGFTSYTVYSDSQEEICNIQNRINKAAEEWRQFGLYFTQSVVSSIKREDWSEVWKKYFKIQHISPSLVIKASWLDYVSENEQLVIEIDPGMSFGTGSHETTQSCLKFIEKIYDLKEKYFNEGMAQFNNISSTTNLSMLDAGCGSGILSIAAAKMGFSPIFAFDYDEECILSTNENIKRNDLRHDQVNLRKSNIRDYSPVRQFDVVVANIISSVLKANSSRISSWVKPGGYIVLAGILKTEYNVIRDIFISNEISEIETVTEKEWTCGLYYKQP